MITAATRKGNQAYRRGYAEADYDIAANGMSYAVSRYMFGSGHGNAFWRGYAARAFRNSGKAARSCDCVLHQGRRLRPRACAVQPLEGGDH